MMLTFLLIYRDGNNLVGWLHIKKKNNLLFPVGKCLGFFFWFSFVFPKQAPQIILFQSFSAFLLEVIIFLQITVLLTCKFICLENT